MRLLLVPLSLTAVVTAANAQFSVVYNFGSHSGDPYSPANSSIVAQGRDGNLYSTADSGGANFEGAVFKITPAGTLSVLYSFTGGSDGGIPSNGLTLGRDGNFYGTTQDGGASTVGTIFKITSTGTLTTLYTLSGADGNTPQAPPTQGMDGNFYGTTLRGGANELGTVYKLTPSGKLTTLYSFNVNGHPAAPLVEGTDGNFYGTTTGGGSSAGAVYKITPAGELTMMEFHGSDGGTAFGPLVQGSDGNIYGTTSAGGVYGAGTIFRITPAGGFNVIHDFKGGASGVGPYTGLVQATDGNFYGTTISGGNSATCCGTIFQISPNTPYPYKVLYNFDLTTGASPEVTLIQHTNGILYGDTPGGGTGNIFPCMIGDCGVFYSLDAGLSPFITFVGTPLGNVGGTVEILGQRFKGTTGVSFNGTPASFTFVRDTFITATVPSGATTGPVTVVTSSGTLTSNKVFVVGP